MTLPDIDDIDTVGGEKENLHPVANPLTDEDAAHRNIAFADAVMATRTLTRSWAKIVTVNGAAPTLSAHNAVWGNSVPVAPTPARTGEGVVTLTYPATVTDDLGETHSVNFRGAWAEDENSTDTRAKAKVTAPNVITVYTFTTAGAADDNPGTTVHVFAV